MSNSLVDAEEFTMPQTLVLPHVFHLAVSTNPVHTWRLQQNAGGCGLVQVYMDTSRHAAVIIKDFHPYRPARMLARVMEQITKEFHPERILVYFIGKIPFDALRKNSFYPKGRYFQKIIEPWRYVITDACFDENGFLINQGLMKDIPFGLFTTSSKGCGWIAAYNLCKINGKEVRMWDCARGLGKLNPMGEMFGQDLATLGWWLKKQGIRFKVVIGKKACIDAMKKSTSGIFLYSHQAGSHYVSYERTGGNRFHFYNALYGKTNYTRSAEDFMKERTKFFKQVLIYVPE